MTVKRTMRCAVATASAGVPDLIRRLLELLPPLSIPAFVFLAVLAGGNAAGAEAGPGHSSPPRKTVLMLSSERSDLPSIPDFERGLRKGLADPAGGVEIFVEYFDFGRFPMERHGAGLVRYLLDRYRERRIDVVVPFQDSAFEFTLAHRDKLFPGVPVVAAGVERQTVEGRTLPPGITTIPVVYDYPRTLALALALQPDARE